VIIPHYDLSGFLSEHKVSQDSITSHRLKGMGSMMKPMTKEERDILQGLVDDSFKQFKEVVRSGRPKFKADPSALDRLATGQVFTADQAVKNGLVDQIGFLEDAVDRAIQLAGVDPAEVQVVRYKPQLSLREMLVGVQARQSDRSDLSVLLELATPRAYYLCSWLPPLVSQQR
jgi:protease-4